MLYFVATPIGNLKDITYRAVEVLGEVDVIACEDTRNSKILLSHYNINKPLIAYHKFNERASTKGILDLLAQGKDVAVISDGGMPIISDPGHVLAQVLSENNIDFTVIPGANAALCALLLSGFSSEMFTFVGFLPEKNSKKEQLLSQIKLLKNTLIFHVSVHNLEKDLQFLKIHLGPRKACLVREITKKFEQKHFFNLGDDLCDVEKRGEFVLVVEGCGDSVDFSNLSVKEHINFYLSQGVEKNQAIKMVAKDRNVKKDEIYKANLRGEE